MLKSFRYRRFPGRAVVLLLVLLLIMPFLQATPAMAQSVSMSPSSGPPGVNSTVTGSGFTDGDTYQIIFAPSTMYEQVLAPATTVSGSSFSRAVTIPSAPWGQYTVRVSSNRGNFSLAFQVTPGIELTVTSGHVSDTVTVNGRGFRGNVSVSVSFNGTVIVTTESNNYGDLAPISFQVPALPLGNYDVFASDGIASSPDITFTINPHLVIEPQEGSVGSQISLKGTGFRASSVITIYWDGAVVSGAQAISSGNGSFSTSLSVPAGIWGSHDIRARDSGFGSDTATFIVRPSITLSPDNGAPGEVISVTGRGFRANRAVEITYNGAAISTQPTNITTDSVGSFSASFTVPGAVSGIYAVRASDGVYSATLTFSVVSNIRLNPSSGHVGTELLVSGTAFTPGGRVALSYDNQAVITVTTDAAGSFSVSFSVPVSRAGQHTVTARDLTTQGVIASATFTMESTPPLVPSLLIPPYDRMANTQPTFSWSAVSDPSGVTYDLQVAWDTGFTQLVLFKQGLAQPEYRVGPSEELQQTKKANPYYWRVRAVDGAGNTSDWTSPGSFYTEDSTAPGQPAAFGPLSGSLVGVQPTFSWSAVSDPSGVTYDLQVAWDTGFNQLVLFKQGLAQPEYQLAPSEELQLTKKANPYYWRVRAVDGAGNAGDWTSPGSFYTEDSTPPPVPTPLSPENGSQQSGNVLFDWTDVSDPGGVTYTLEVAQDSDFQHLVVYKEGLETSEYQLTKAEELSPTTGNPPVPYYWRVKALDSYQNQSDWGTINAFYVRGFLQGWALYIIMAVGAIVLVAIGVFVGMRLRPSQGV